MRESTKSTVSLLSSLWQAKWPTADIDALMLIDEIVEAYKQGTVSPESCMEEISYLMKVRMNRLEEVGREEEIELALSEAKEIPVS